MTKKSYYPDADQNLDFAKMEENILKFWQENKVFEKSVEIRNHAHDEDDHVSPVKEPCALKDHKNCRHDEIRKSEFVFYDGPPFANGLPHYGHLLTGFIKDIFARYQTMQGKKVERKFGWDTHGLPVEMETEKELTAKEGRNISGQIAIQEYGIEKFNEACKVSVMKYAGEWRNYVSRQGRWVDFDNSYKTMDLNYMESVLWAFNQLYEKGLLYEDFRVVPYSWACQTPLSNFETRMDNSYRQKASKAVTIKFELTEESHAELVEAWNKNDKSLFDKLRVTSLVAWTTTPWTLPSNLAVAVGKEIDYAIVKKDDEALILASNLVEKFSKDLGSTEILKTVKGAELVGLKYKPLFPYLTKNEKVKAAAKVFSVLHGDFVSTEEGTGIVHMAPGFGEDDQILSKANGIPTLCPVDEGGKFTPEMYDLNYGSSHDPATLQIKGKQVFETNDDIIKYLKAQGSWIKTEQYLHNYPHCWRTDTPLIYRAVSSWYVEVTKFKDRMVELNSGRPVFNKEKIPATIETKRLRGEVVTSKHFDIIKKQILSNEEVRKYYYFAPYQICNDSQAQENFDYWQRQWELGLPRFALFEKSTGDFVGIAGLCFYNPKFETFENGPIEVSYTLAQNHWGKGFATEITHELIDYAFLNYPIDYLCAATVSDNIGSQKVLEKSGFKVLRKSKNSCPKGGKDKNYEEFYYELHKKDEKGINWIPPHIRDGQFGKWLEGARDWSITRNRFWGCPVPVWKSPSNKIKVFGSIAELEKISGKKITNLHRPYIDDITFEIDGEKYKRVTDVLDCWFESGSMPYAQVHYPFENKEWFEENFPADFITEYVAQTRGWFYTLMVLSTALFDKAPFKNVICHGTILDENSQKLSKRLRNYVDPLEVFSSYGADAMRFYMISQPVMRGQELKIDKDGKSFKDTLRLSIKPLINAYNFFCLYANSDGVKANRIEYQTNQENILDNYILAKLKSAVVEIEKAMSAYDTVKACEEFNNFFEALNNWYIRRSRNRFWKSEIDQDKQDAYNTLYTCLVTMCEASAPLLPFTTEFVWKNLQGK